MKDNGNTSKLIGLLIGCFTAIAVANANAQTAKPAEIDAAVNRATAFLLAAQKGDNWESVPAPAPEPAQIPGANGGQWSGITAITTYALLCAGVPRSDPHIIGAIAFLETTEPRGTYAAAARCMVWGQLTLDKKTRPAARRDFTFLLTCLHRSGEAIGAFDYTPQPVIPGFPAYDQSASQFAVLGIWSLCEAGFEVNTSDWDLMDTAWRSHQKEDGSWPYYDRAGIGWDRHTASMTAAGIASLSIIDQTWHPQAVCKGNPVDPNIVKGLEWLANNFDDTFVPIRQGYYVQPYTLFALSRVGAATGYKYFGKVDWYAAATDYLLKAQQPDGSWGTNYLDPIPGTSLGLLGLSYGRAPVLFNKLRYEIDGRNPRVAGHWNQRPQDCMNFTNWLGKKLESRFNWQIVTLESPADDLQSAPILFISGNEALRFSDPQKRSLRRYVDRGGLILGNADCSSEEFSSSFAKLAGALFPDYEMRLLPADHPIYTAEQYPGSKWKSRSPLMGVSNGVRELMLLPKDDLSQWFQRKDDTGGRDRYQLASDIVLYATGQTELKKKGDSFIVNRDPSIAATQKATVVRLSYAGNWDPEPGGWERLAAYMHNVLKVDLEIKVDEHLDQPIPLCTIAHLTGTSAFVSTPAQEAQLKNFVTGGGTLVIDAAGGSGEFASSIDAMLTKLFPNQANLALPPDNALFTTPATKGAIRYRHFAASMLGLAALPQIKVIKIEGRNAVYSSRFDLSAGLVGMPVDGIVGYSPDSATRLMAAIISQQPAIK